MKTNNINIGEKVLGWFIVREGEGKDEDDKRNDKHEDVKVRVRARAPSTTDAHEDTAPPTTKSPSSPPMKKASGITRSANTSASSRTAQTSNASARPSVAAAPRQYAANATTSTSSTTARHDATGFSEVYRAKGLTSADTERLAKILDLLTSLPDEAPQDVKRTIVGAAMQAFGVPLDQIMATANGAMAALDAYVAEGDHQTRTALDQAETRIEALNAEIAKMQSLVETERAAQDELTHASAIEKARVHAVIDFFQDQSRAVSATRPQLIRLK